MQMTFWDFEWKRKYFPIKKFMVIPPPKYVPTTTSPPSLECIYNLNVYSIFTLFHLFVRTTVVCGRFEAWPTSAAGTTSALSQMSVHKHFRVMKWQDFKELNFIPFNKDAIFHFSSWTLERALICILWKKCWNCTNLCLDVENLCKYSNDSDFFTKSCHVLHTISVSTVM